jgi:hypothetical protein
MSYLIWYIIHIVDHFEAYYKPFLVGEVMGVIAGWFVDKLCLEQVYPVSCMVVMCRNSSKTGLISSTKMATSTKQDTSQDLVQAHESLYINHIALSTPSVLPQHPPSNVSMLLVKRAIILSYFPSVLLRNLCTFWKFICYSKFMCFNLIWYIIHIVDHFEAYYKPFLVSVLPQHPPSNVSIISGHNYSTLPPYTTQGTLVLSTVCQQTSLLLPPSPLPQGMVDSLFYQHICQFGPVTYLAVAECIWNKQLKQIFDHTPVLLGFHFL